MEFTPGNDLRYCVIELRHAAMFSAYTFKLRRRPPEIINIGCGNVKMNILNIAYMGRSDVFVRVIFIRWLC